MLSNMAASLIMHKRINTTLAKAKALRVYIEPLLTKAKDDTTASRRVVFSYLVDKSAVTELFREIAPKIAKRQGGYTRILKTGYRLGDNAEMAMMELVDYNENMLSDGKGKAKTRRSRGKKADAASVAVRGADAKAAAEVPGEGEVSEDVVAEAAAVEVPAEAATVAGTPAEGEVSEDVVVEAAAVEVPAEAVVETPAEVVVETPAKSEVSGDVVVEAAAVETPAEAVAETPVEAVAEAVAETPAEAISDAEIVEETK
jgi:large subunit ribosomal protein L17